MEQTYYLYNLFHQIQIVHYPVTGYRSFPEVSVSYFLHDGIDDGFCDGFYAL